MPPNNGGRGGKSNGKKADPLLDSLRDACPPHKKNDLDKLYKQMNGDEAKIREAIQLWWNEPLEQEEVWEDVTKKAAKKLERERDAARAGRGRGPGRGGRGRGERGGGRGAGERERGRGEGRGAGPKKEPKEEAKPENGEKSENPAVAPVSAPQDPTVPVPVSKAPAVKGAWGARTAAAPPALAPAPAPVAAAEPVKKAPVIVEESTLVPEFNPLDMGLTAAQSTPTPSAIAKSAPVAAGVNVWATKGSAHLIQAEKPKPPPVHVSPPAPAPVAPIAPAPIVMADQQDRAPSQIVPEAALKSAMPSGAWGKPVPMADPVPAAPLPAPVPVPLSPARSAPPPPKPAAPSNVLNMGHWDSGDAGDSQQLDFGFGSFGADADAGAVDASQAVASPPAPKETNPAMVSPARPPPGLSLGGMPAMPEGAVMVSDLENKMESASLTAQKNDESTPISSSLPHSAPTLATPALGMHGVAPVQQNYNQYGMPGMYNYNAAAGGGFVGMTPAGPVLAGGVVPGQPGKPDVALSAAGGLYGSQPPAGPMSGIGPESSIDNASAPGPTAGAIPPGMPGTIPYGNPALAHYGQHQYYMGQAQGGIGYNYGYGQFGGVAQGGFGYQQVMGQNQGYGAPHYDDHSQQNAHQPGGSGGYHKNTGGYRGRNNHHNNHHYQNQYNPQHGGYGGQPYGMGYQADQFNQRGGYGPGAMGAPYGMQQQGHAGNFQEDDHQKGKKGGRGGFQQGPPQGFGLQDQSTQSNPSSAGWSNNQGGGWSTGAPSWQGGNN